MRESLNSPKAKSRRFRPYPKYKDSGVEWLGEIPTHWEVMRFGFNADFIVPMRDKPLNLTGPIPWIRIEDFEGKHIGSSKSGQGVDDETMREMNLKVFPIGAVLCSCSCNMGATAIVSHPLVSNQTFIGIVPSLNYGSEYIYYLMQVAKQHLTALATGAIQQYLSRNDFSSLRMPQFPEAEQRIIAAFLDRETAKIDALLEKKERLIELLKEKRTALITQAVTKGLDPNVPMKDSGVEWLGTIPAHWRTEANRRLFFESNKRSLLGEEELLTVSHITGVTPRSEKNVTMIEAESHEGYKICQKGELAINTMWAWMGALGIAWEDGMVSPSYNVYVSTSAVLNPRYYNYLCRIPIHVTELTRLSKGIWKSRLRLYPEGFYEISTPLPAKTEQEMIADFIDSEVDKIDALMKTIMKAIDLLKEYRTALISAAVTGKIDLQDV